VVVFPTPPFWLAIAMTRPIPLRAGADSVPTWWGEDCNDRTGGADYQRQLSEDKSKFHVEPCHV